ncbi:hypothetical protein EXN66_Car000727 [Channa argus]|uniref:Uncharacterized protein n=1 Tax=Channa argus TaxID=215402 RepID=A0A6G1QYI3_CHAAH|nr:hypothetical protein EXN66_Car000727 [Channa argus]
MIIRALMVTLHRRRHFVQQEVLNSLSETDSVSVHPINLISPFPDSSGAPGFATEDKTRGEDYEW